FFTFAHTLDNYHCNPIRGLTATRSVPHLFQAIRQKIGRPDSNLKGGPWRASPRRKMVGAPGFEPGTSRTPSVRATRLRYAPTVAARHFGRVHPSKRYHLPSSSVKKLRSVSRRSSSSLRLRCAAGAVAVLCATFSRATSPCAPFPASSRKWRLAPAIVNPSSYNRRLILSTRSTSSWRYSRCRGDSSPAATWETPSPSSAAQTALTPRSG